MTKACATDQRRKLPASVTPAGWELPLAVAMPTAAFLFLPAAWPKWFTMWLLAFGIFATCKWLSWKFADRRHVSLSRQAGYLFAWCGLDANSFLQDSTAAMNEPPAAAEWIAAARNLIAGLCIVLTTPRWSGNLPPLLLGWGELLGLALILHFGSFQLLSCYWRWRGIRAKPLMRQPIGSTSVSDFWSHRWNTAFRDMAHEFLFRPWRKRVGPRGALFAGFLFSGVVHDLVISLPAGGGYGLPTMYFLGQAVGVMLERSSVGKKLRLGQGVRGWLFTILIVVGPAYWLFHPPFIHNVVLPFIKFLSGAS